MSSSIIADLRREARVTQKELAAAVYVTQGTISHYETGRRAVPSDVAQRIAEYLSADPKDVHATPPAVIWLRHDGPMPGWTVVGGRYPARLADMDPTVHRYVLADAPAPGAEEASS